MVERSTSDLRTHGSSLGNEETIFLFGNGFHVLYNILDLFTGL